MVDPGFTVRKIPVPEIFWEAKFYIEQVDKRLDNYNRTIIKLAY